MLRVSSALKAYTVLESKTYILGNNIGQTTVLNF